SHTTVGARPHNTIGPRRAERGDSRGAAEQFALAARWNPQLEQIYFNWGLACYKAELYEQPIQPLENELKANPASVSAKQLLGTSYFMTDNYRKASELLADVIQSRGNDTGLYYMLAISLIKQKKHEAANQVIERMVAMTGDSPH